ncbi:MAG: hypothetical protein K8R85_13730 [Bacteroidetes bacterium]|nr:hypothetical protein [Bacteroidota bacterium]
MVNKKHNSKLDEVIKETLSNYEASNSIADWAKMEGMLDAAPKSNSFRYKHKLLSIFESVKGTPKSKVAHWIFSPYFLIALILVIGAYFLYNILNSSKTSENTTNSTPQAIINTDTLQKITPVLPVEVLKAENKIELPKDSIITEPPVEVDLVKSNDIETVKKAAMLAKEAALIEKAKIKKDQIIKKESIIKSDSSKTVSRELDEKNVINPVQEENKEQSIIPLGRNNFLLYNNSDSMKKNQNQQSNDSLKGPN